jgi:NADH-quinone oxidoreductase subunit H
VLWLAVVVGGCLDAGGLALYTPAAMSAPSFLTAQFLVSALTIAIVVHVILITCAYLIYVERKICAYVQDRIGPNRVGFDFGQPWLSPLKGCLGLGQSLADGLKFLLKEDYTPPRRQGPVHARAAIIIIPALIGFIVIPGAVCGTARTSTSRFSDWVIPGGPVHIAGANFNVGVVYLLAVGSLGVYGVTLGGWASNNKYSFLGGLACVGPDDLVRDPAGPRAHGALLIVGTVVPSRHRPATRRPTAG